MKIVANWQAVLKHAWSLRFIALSLLLSAPEAALAFLALVVPVQAARLVSAVTA
jgi:hypothetical protein